MNEKDQFVAAYMYSYGTTKKAALKAWRESSEETRRLIISHWENQCKQSFYND